MSAKHRIVIPPFAIQTPPEWSQKIPTVKQSFFSNGYDYNGEEKRLGNLFGGVHQINIFNVKKDNSEYEAVRQFSSHRQLLQKYIRDKRLAPLMGADSINPFFKNAGATLEDIESFMSADSKFDSIGKLRDVQQDYVLLHTKQAVRAWEGMNDKNRIRERWPGIRYVMALTAELIKMTQDGNPFAHAALIKFEHELSQTADFLKAETDKMRLLVERVNTSGIHIGVVENEKPVSIPVGHIRGYGFSLIQLLTAYDMYIRLAKTLMLKGLLENSVCNKIIREGGSHIRRLNQNLYLVTMKMRKIKNLSRHDFLNDEDGSLGKRLKTAIDEKAVDPIPHNVLIYETVPQYIFLRCPFSAADLEKMTAYAAQYGLLAIGEEA